MVRRVRTADLFAYSIPYGFFGRLRAVGYAVARQLGVEVDEEKAVALGLQWLNTPRWRRVVA
jgi:hypothetical protein